LFPNELQRRSEMTSSRATPSILVGYKPLYKGRRFWIFENNPAKPFDRWTGDSRILAYDRKYEALAACGNYKEDGSISAEYVGGQGVKFNAFDLAGMARELRWIDKVYV
jgi:hypothetical protein